VRVGHTALTWDVLSQPDQLAVAIADCAALGFAGTETGGRVYDWWCEQRPGELERLLAQADVVLACLFQFGDWTEVTAAPGLLADGRRWAEALTRLGGDVLMLVPGRRRDAPPYSLDEFQQMATTMNRVGELAHQAGVVAAMHPHWGTVAETRLEIEVLLDRLDPALVGFAPDTGQIAKGGADPFPIVERWADRVRHVHLKDVARDWEAKRQSGVPLRSPEGYVELGQGVLDLRRLLPILEAAQYRGWLMAELDESALPARESAALSHRYLVDVLGLGEARS
jgi:inosose dehydratase